MKILCNYCHKPTNASLMQDHIKAAHPEKTTIGDVKSTKRFKVQTMTKTVAPTEIKKTVTYEILSNGQLVIVDGLHFYVKNNVAFLDCPMCVEKSMAMTLLPEHLYEDHNLQ